MGHKALLADMFGADLERPHPASIALDNGFIVRWGEAHQLGLDHTPWQRGQTLSAHGMSHARRATACNALHRKSPTQNQRLVTPRGPTKRPLRAPTCNPTCRT